MKRFLTFCVLLFSVSSSLANTLVLVSVDGFCWDYLDWPEAQSMKRMAEQGVRVNQLQAVYPSKTFPAHLSIATGLRPTRHGVADNYFCRSDRPDCYRMGLAKRTLIGWRAHHCGRWLSSRVDVPPLFLARI